MTARWVIADCGESQAPDEAAAEKKELEILKNMMGLPDTFKEPGGATPPKQGKANPVAEGIHTQ